MRSVGERQLYEQSQEEIISYLDYIPNNREELDHPWKIKSNLDVSEETIYIKTGYNVNSSKSIIHDLKNITQEVIKTTSIMDEPQKIIIDQHKYVNHLRVLQRSNQHKNLHERTFKKMHHQVSEPSQYQRILKKSSINNLTKMRNGKINSNPNQFYKAQRIRILQQIDKDMNLNYSTSKSSQKGIVRKRSERKIIIHQIVKQLKSKSTQQILLKPKQALIKPINYLQYTYQQDDVQQKEKKKKKWLQAKNQIKQAMENLSPKRLIRQQEVQQVQKQNILKESEIKQVYVEVKTPKQNPPIINREEIGISSDNISNSQQSIYTFTKTKGDSLYSFNHLAYQNAQHSHHPEAFQKHTKNVSIEISQQKITEKYLPLSNEMVLGCIYCGILKKRCTFH